MLDDKEKLDKLYNQVQKIHSMLEKMTKNEKVYFINIEKVDFHGPILDELEFIFDKIDVKEVSGALNIGNNFGVSVEGNKEKKNENVKASGMNINSKEKVEKTSNTNTTANEENPSDEKFSDLEKILEKKLEQAFQKGPKTKKKNHDSPKNREQNLRVLPVENLKQPGQLRKISINKKTIVKQDYES